MENITNKMSGLSLQFSSLNGYQPLNVNTKIKNDEKMEIDRDRNTRKILQLMNDSTLGERMLEQATIRNKKLKLIGVKADVHPNEWCYWGVLDQKVIDKYGTDMTIGYDRMTTSELMSVPPITRYEFDVVIMW